jgi:carbamoyltransferase
LDKLNLDYFLHHNHNVSHTWNDSTPVFGRLFSNNLIELLGPPRLKSDEITQKHMDIARSVQDIYEKALFHVLNYAYDISKIKNLCLAGGCAMNSVANGRIYSSTHFKKLYVQAAAGDAGGAIGAAYYVWNKIGGKRHFCMDHAYYGPEFDSSYIENLLDINSKIISRKFNVRFIESADLLCKVDAKSIAKGSVIGWFQGRMEWGPRALGNRSILGDPRRADMKDILNIKIKRRESFRPFAPSILEEHSDSWFESYDSVPFMMQVFQVKKNKRKIIPAVTHVDGSGRLQTVSKKTNSLYHLLITNFFELVGLCI